MENSYRSEFYLTDVTFVGRVFAKTVGECEDILAKGLVFFQELSGGKIREIRSESGPSPFQEDFGGISGFAAHYRYYVRDTKKRLMVQLRNPKTDRYVKIDRGAGIIVSSKKSNGPYKNIPVAD